MKSIKVHKWKIYVEMPLWIILYHKFRFKCIVLWTFCPLTRKGESQKMRKKYQRQLEDFLLPQLYDVGLMYEKKSFSWFKAIACLKKIICRIAPLRKQSQHQHRACWNQRTYLITSLLKGRGGYRIFKWAGMGWGKISAPHPADWFLEHPVHNLNLFAGYYTDRYHETGQDDTSSAAASSCPASVSSYSTAAQQSIGSYTTAAHSTASLTTSDSPGKSCWAIDPERINVNESRPNSNLTAL